MKIRGDLVSWEHIHDPEPHNIPQELNPDKLDLLCDLVYFPVLQTYNYTLKSTESICMQPRQSITSTLGFRGRSLLESISLPTSKQYRHGRAIDTFFFAFHMQIECHK